jgi:hypothetical protein
VSDDRVKEEALVGDEADDVEAGSEDDGDNHSDSEKEDSDDRPSKRYVNMFI